MKSQIAVAMVLVATLPIGLMAKEMQKSLGKSDAGMNHVVIMPDAVKWGPPPPFMPPGAQIAIMLGEPAKKGLFIIRGKMPDGYTIPPHWHSTIENVTVLSGTFNIGMGDKLDKSKGQALAPGGFFSAPPRMSHFGWATGETVVEVTGTGPLNFKYVDPKDDPSKAANIN